jgi:hypothetical protein
MAKWPTVEEALETAQIMEKVIGDDGIWSSEDTVDHDQNQHSKLTNHHMRALIVLARKIREEK